MNLRLPLLTLALLATLALHARDLEFAGFTWTVRSGTGGPGPNAWETRNVWLDHQTNLHLKITHRDGQWSCAEVTLRRRLGFGRYEFRVSGRLDQFDDNVVLGLFNYPPGEVGPDGTHEIDIEFARWGEAKNPLGNFTVWPAEKGLRQVTHAFPWTQATEQTTHRFHWTRPQIEFLSLANPPGDTPATWVYRPAEPTQRISTQPMPVHINLWLFRGSPPKNGQEVEIVIQGFSYQPTPD